MVNIFISGIENAVFGLKSVVEHLTHIVKIQFFNIRVVEVNCIQEKEKKRFTKRELIYR